jgi:hypothetical protein
MGYGTCPLMLRTVSPPARQCHMNARFLLLEIRAVRESAAGPLRHLMRCSDVVGTADIGLSPEIGRS